MELLKERRKVCSAVTTARVLSNCFFFIWLKYTSGSGGGWGTHKQCARPFLNDPENLLIGVGLKVSALAALLLWLLLRSPS